MTATDGTLTNSGTISATANAIAADTASAYAYAVDMSYLNGTLTNSGTISGVVNGDLPENGYSLHISSGTGMVMNEAGALLFGNLYAGGSISVDNQGTISLPTGSDAYIGGDYTQGNNGRLEIGATSVSNYASLGIGGTATLEDGTGLAVNVAANNTLADGDELTDVVYSGYTLTATTLNLTDNSGLFDFSYVIDGDTIDLTANRNSITSILARTGKTGGNGAGALFDDLLTRWENTGDAGGMQDAVDILRGLQTTQQVSDAIDSTLPILNGDMPRAIAGVKHGTNRIVRSRQGGNQGMNSGDQFFTDGNIWVKPFASTATQDDNNGAMGFDADSYGLVLGVDGKISDKFRLGFAFAYSTTDVTGNSGDTRDASVDSYQGIVYASHDLNQGIELNWQVDYGAHSNEITRSMPLFGRVAKADYNSWSAHAGVEAAKDVALGAKTTLTPSVLVDYTMIEDDGYTETGADSLNLSVDKNKTDELIFGVAGKLTQDLGGNMSIAANLGVGYDALADDDSITASYAGEPSAAFTTTGIDPSPWIYGGGLGLSMGSKDKMEFTVRYDVEGRKDFLDQSVSLKLVKSF